MTLKVPDFEDHSSPSVGSRRGSRTSELEDSDSDLSGGSKNRLGEAYGDADSYGSGEQGAPTAGITGALASLPLFRGCDDAFLHMLARCAQRLELPVGDSIDLESVPAILVIESGALQVSVLDPDGSPGQGSTVMGPGSVLCTPLALGLQPLQSGRGDAQRLGLLLAPAVQPLHSEQPAHRSSRALSRSSSCGPALMPALKAVDDAEPEAPTGEEVEKYEVQPPGAPPRLFPEERPQLNSQDRWQTLLDPSLGFYGLCPHACEPEDPDPPKPLRLVAKAFEATVVAKKHNGRRRATAATHNATMLAISVAAIEAAGLANMPSGSPRLSRSKRTAMLVFEENRRALKASFRALQRWARGLLPGAPSEVLWRLAEVARQERVEAGALVVAAGGLGFAGDQGDARGEALLILTAGRAVVEKSQALGEVIKVGQLGPGAIIGELCLLGAKVSHPISVRAVTDVEVLVLPSKALLQVLLRFPGVLGCLQDRLRRVAMFLQEGQPAPDQVLRSVALFEAAPSAVVKALARRSQFQVFHLGQCIKEEGSEDSSLFVLQHGVCNVETRWHGQIADLHRGSFFGERSFGGRSTRCNATIRAASPLVLVFSVSGQDLQEVARAHPWEVAPTSMGTATSSARSALANLPAIGHIEAFRLCTPAFCESISAVAETRSYMPGQLLIEEGARDAAQTFVVCMGHVAAEKGGALIAEMSAGASFGELLMLGLSDSRTVSIRALTFCNTVEISQAGFHLVCAKHPEERHFESFHKKLGEKRAGEGPVWKIAEGMPPGFEYLMNSAAERRFCDAEDNDSLTLRELGRAVVHILQGNALVLDGRRVLLSLHPGDCFNQESLLGFPNFTSERMMLQGDCEIQILKKNPFDYACWMFAEERQLAKANILRTLLPRLERRQGFSSGELTLQTSALFRVTPWELATASRERLQPLMLEPGQVLLEEGTEGDKMFFLLEGALRVEVPTELRGAEEACQELVGPCAVAESALLGTLKCHSATVRATRHCVLGALSRCSFQEALALLPEAPKELAKLDRTVDEGEHLQKWLRQRPSFAKCSKEFLRMLTIGVQHTFFAPGETVVANGEACRLGESPWYAVLAGEAEVQGEAGSFIDTLSTGDVFGEAGALGLDERRLHTVRARLGDGAALLQCAVLSGRSLKAAMERFPEAGGRLRRLYLARADENDRAWKKRTEWLREHVEPLLLRSSLFSQCPAEFVRTVSCRVRLERCESDEAIFELGQAADSMLLIVEGSVELQARKGETVGTFGPGACFGEAAVLGLFPRRTATLRARKKCRLAVITTETLQTVLKLPEFEGIREAVERLKAERHEQVRLGLPISAMPLNVGADDVCARMVALQAMRLILVPGAVLQPLSDGCPDGPHFSVLVRGRARLEMANDGRWVASLKAVSFLPEGLVAGHGAVVRAEVACEAYRVRQADFLVAAGAVPQAAWSGAHPPLKDWYERCRLLEREARSRLGAAFEMARGAQEAAVRPPSAPGSITDATPWGKRFQASDLFNAEPFDSPEAESAPPPEVLNEADAGWSLTRRLPGGPTENIPRRLATHLSCPSPPGGQTAPARVTAPSWLQSTLTAATRPGTAETTWAAEPLRMRTAPAGLGLGLGRTRPLGCTGGRARPGSRGAARSLAGSVLPMLGVSGRPGSSGTQTRAFRDKSGCGPGDLLIWTLPQATK